MKAPPYSPVLFEHLQENYWILGYEDISDEQRADAEQWFEKSVELAEAGDREHAGELLRFVAWLVSGRMPLPPPVARWHSDQLLRVLAGEALQLPGTAGRPKANRYLSNVRASLVRQCVDAELERQRRNGHTPAVSKACMAVAERQQFPSLTDPAQYEFLPHRTIEDLYAGGLRKK